MKTEYAIISCKYSTNYSTLGHVSTTDMVILKTSHVWFKFDVSSSTKFPELNSFASWNITVRIKLDIFETGKKVPPCKCRSVKWESPEHRDVPAHTMSNEEDVYHVTVETTQETIRKVVYSSIVV